MNNIATTIEQSKQLVRLGLDPKTADMSYSEEYFDKDKDGNDEWCWRLNACKFINVEGIIPAWSLSALLEVMPANIKIDDDQYFLYLEKDDGNIQGERYTCYYFSYYTCEVDDESALFSTATYDNTIDAAYEMVCWLLEQGLIEKGGQDESKD